MEETGNDIIVLDKLKASKRLLAVLEEGEGSARGKGWITADEVEIKLDFD